MDLLKKEIAKPSGPKNTGPMPSVRKPLALTVAHRRQTPEEQRRFNAAFDIFLAELVRLHLDRTDK